MMSSKPMEARRLPRVLNEALAQRLPADWIVGQQIGVLAYALTHV